VKSWAILDYEYLQYGCFDPQGLDQLYQTKKREVLLAMTPTMMEINAESTIKLTALQVKHASLMGINVPRSKPQSLEDANSTDLYPKR
jgi:hypothetical protein